MRFDSSATRCAWPLALLFVATVCRAQVIALPGGAAHSYEIRNTSNSPRFASFSIPTVGGVEPQVSMSAAPRGWTHVDVKWPLPGPVAVDDIAVKFDIELRPDFQWIPHLTPIGGTIVAQHVFRSPAIIVAERSATLAIVPDLDSCGDRTDAPWYLDYDAVTRKACLGMSLSARPAHVLFTRQPGMQLAGGSLYFGFFVKAYDDASTPRNPFGETAQFMWERFGAPAQQEGGAHDVAMGELVSQAYVWLFSSWKEIAWRESRDGVVAGTQLLVDFSQSPSGRIAPLTSRPTEIWNQAWYCALRSAGGMLRRGRALGDVDLLRRAAQSKELALSAPQVEGGVFPSVATIPLVSPPNVFDRSDIVWTNSDRSPHERGIDREWYHVLDASNTALWMLRWYRELDPDPRLLAYVTSYADWLLTRQLSTGFFPAWLHPETLVAADLLLDSPESARSAGLLLELFDATGNVAYRDAGLRALHAVVRGPAQDGRWEDFETYWSDNFFGTVTHVGRKFDRNGMYKQNTLSMFWTAEALLRAHRLTGRPGYLGWARRVLDELSLWQQVWQPAFMYVPCVGGFGVMNVDGEWNDARQSLFAETFLDFYAVTGERRYFERGVAALEASFTMMYSPLLPMTRTQWQAAHPSLAPIDHGFQMENYGHWGSADPVGDGMGFFAIFDWGAGAASEAFLRIVDHWGQVYIDRTRGHAFGIDNIDVVAEPAGGWRLHDRTCASTGRSVQIRFEDGSSQTVWLSGTAVVQ